MSRGRILGTVVVAMLLLLPASASAVSRYVAQTGGADSGDCANSASPCATINYAVFHAANGDTIQIGPGSYVEEVNTDKTLTYIGAGAGHLGGLPAQTRIKGPTTVNLYGLPAMTLPSGGTVKSLRAEGGDGAESPAPSGEAGAPGVRFPSDTSASASLHLEDAVVVGGDGGQGTQFPGTAGLGIQVNDVPGPVALSAVGSELAGGTGLGGGIAVSVYGPSASADIANSRIPNETSFGPGIVAYSGARVSIESTEVTAVNFAATIYDGLLAIKRSRLTSGVAPLYVSASNNESPEADIVDSLIVGAEGEALSVNSEEQGSATVSVLGSTLIGHGISAAEAKRAEGAGPATITLRNSIARDLVPPGFPVPAVDLRADGGTISADFSSFSTRAEENGGTVSAPGSAANVAGDPLLIDEQHGVFVPQGTSPLIDRGDPGIVQPGQLDLLGSPRSLDGNRDCVAVPDIGAFEVTGRQAPCDLPPELSEVGITNRVFAPVSSGGKKARGARESARRRRVKHGTRFTYRLSEPARVSITIERRLRGRRVRRAGSTRCVRPTPTKTKPRCFRFVKATALSAEEQAGRQSTFFSGRNHGRPVKPGRYRARIWAVDAAGQKSQTRQVSFRIVRGS